MTMTGRLKFSILTLRSAGFASLSAMDVKSILCIFFSLTPTGYCDSRPSMNSVTLNYSFFLYSLFSYAVF